MNTVSHIVTAQNIFGIVVIASIFIVLLYACISGYQHMKKEYEERKAEGK
jgi:uncharacterized protein YpmB